MDSRETQARWERLLLLLAPIHTQAVLTARRLSRSADDGDDLYQETVLRAFEKLDTLRHEGSFRSWFFATLLSRHRSRARGAFWRRFVSLESDANEARGTREPVGERGEEWDEESWGAARMSRALGHLPAVQREAIVLFELQGFPIEEIAGLQHASLSAVKTRLARGRAALRSYYERRGWAGAVAPPVGESTIAAVVLGSQENLHDRA
ncbi:MAG: RNA polymerase sigma factor [Candidatus Eiseniibacteriota bacterium]